MLLPTGALSYDTKNVCEGHDTLYEYPNPFFFTMMHQVVSNFSTCFIFTLQLIICYTYYRAVENHDCYQYY